MDRRELLIGAGAAVLAAATSKAAFSAEHDHQHQHNHMSTRNQKLIDSTSICIQKGQACVRHCLNLLSQGDKEMAACAISVNQMLATCDALEKLASFESKHLAKMAKLTMDVCKECEDECRKHANKHFECKECADACAVCLKECKSAAA